MGGRQSGKEPAASKRHIHRRDEQKCRWSRERGREMEGQGKTKEETEREGEDRERGAGGWNGVREGIS